MRPHRRGIPRSQVDLTIGGKVDSLESGLLDAAEAVGAPAEAALRGDRALATQRHAALPAADADAVLAQAALAAVRVGGAGAGADGDAGAAAEARRGVGIRRADAAAALLAERARLPVAAAGH